MLSTPAIPATAPDELPARSRRDRWRSLPGWFRILCWATLGAVLFEIAIAVRIRIGLIESPEIQHIRQAGGIVLYPWRSGSPEPFQGYYLILDGLSGRSARNVHAVILPRGKDELIHRCLTDFPHVKVIVMTELPIEVNDYFFYSFCLMMEQQFGTTEPIIIDHADGRVPWKRIRLPSQQST